VLVDVGLSGREIRRRLKTIGVHGENLDAIVVSHEHSDHTRGLRVLSNEFNLPVYINYDTLSSVHGKEIKGKIREFESGNPFAIGGLSFQPFSVPHDAVDPVGYTIKYRDLKIGIATDLGFATKLVIERLKDCDLLILESNHDEEMLKSGPYPWVLKQRVMSRQGHLSNNQAGTLIKEVYHEGLKHIILFHLSETNNRPEKAGEGVNFLFKNNKYHPIHVLLAMQDRVGEMISISPENKWI